MTIFSYHFDDVHVVGRNLKKKLSDKNVHSINQKLGCTIIPRILKYISLNFFISIKILLLHNSVNKWIFFLGGESFLPPIFLSRIINKKVIIILAGSAEDVGNIRNSNFTFILRILKNICCRISNKIILYSPRLIISYKLEHFRKKILIASHHFLDFSSFHISISFQDRSPLIGYFGRLSKEKGVQFLVNALPDLLNYYNDFHVLIGGEGDLKELIISDIQRFDIIDKVSILGWVSHEILPQYLNRMRLLVLPSFTEGLPNIIIEAMACGTPVLATPVGAVPDIITDGVTGFIMENNTPDCIVKNIKRAIKCSNLKEISENGRLFVKEHYSYDTVVEKWRQIIQDI